MPDLDQPMLSSDRLITRVNRDGDFNLVAPPDESLNHISILFSAQADRFANCAAIVRGNGSISYGELNRRANRWANLLRSLGVDREVVVALCLGRSIE